MKFQRICLASIKLISSISLLFPFAAFAHLISITATTPFPSTVRILSTTTATFTVTNITSRTTLTVIDQSQFPSGSGLSIVSSTCGNPIGPGQTCNINVQLQASSNSKTISAELREWAKPSADGVRFPFSVAVIGPQQFTITPIAGAGGTISPSTPQIVNSGGSLTFTAMPASGFTVNQWLLDGLLVQTGGTTYTLSNITSNHTVNVTCALGIPVAVGYSYDSSGNNQLPLAYTSSDGGSNWTLSSAFSLPGGQTQGFLNAVNCIGSACVAVGYSYDSSGNNNLPLAYTSSDGGSNWTLSSAFVLPSGQPQGYLAGVNCIGTTCTAVGYSYDNSFNNNLPFAYTSSDGGSNWTLSSAFVLPSGQPQGFLAGVNCIGSACVAVGESYDNSFNNNLPFAYTSSDGGSNWTLSSAFVLPSGQPQGYLAGVNCIGTTCTAVGYSYDSFNNNLPFAYTSSDGGSNWTLSSAFVLPSGQPQGFLAGVNCIGSACVAVGESYDNSFNNNLPFAYTSSDGGSNWTLSSAFVLPSGQPQAHLNAVNCIGTTCTAVGYSFDNSFGNQLPLAYKSIDGGSNWMLSSAFVLPSGQTQGSLYGIASGNGSSFSSYSGFRKFGTKRSLISH